MSGLRAKGVGLVLALLLAGSAAAETIDRVLAVVAGQLIMLSDVSAVSALGIVTPAPGDDATASVLGKLIDRELMLAEVDRYAPPEPETSEIDREMVQVRARVPSEKAFNDILARSGFDTAHVRELVRQNLRLRAYLDQRFTATDGNQQRRQQLIDDWVVSLRRRTPVINLYQPRP